MSSRFLSPALLPRRDITPASSRNTPHLLDGNRPSNASTGRPGVSLQGPALENPESVQNSEGNTVIEGAPLAPRFRDPSQSQTYNLWVHDEKFSKNELVLNPDFFPHIQPGDLLLVYHPDNRTSYASRQGSTETELDSRHGYLQLTVPNQCMYCNVQSKRLVIMASALDKETIAKQPLLQVSISHPVASVFSLKARTSVVVEKIEGNAVAASYVEVAFKDQYLGRSDMWRLKMSLCNTCVYVGKKVLFAGCIRVQIKSIAINSREVACGYITPETRLVFRSESSRCYLFVQLSIEMWEFEEDGFLFSEKALNGFLPDLTERWKLMGTNHVVSVILFTRITYPEDAAAAVGASQLPTGQWYRDFYKVIVDCETRSDWAQVIKDLKHSEMVFFQRDILQHEEAGYTGVVGTNTSAADGNILEALNMALNGFDRHYVDRDLIRTGLCIIIVTPGSGLFRVDKHLLRMTFERMNDSGISLDLVFLSKPPLHQVPLFQFKSSVPPSAVNEGGTKLERLSVGTDGSRSLRVEPLLGPAEARLDPRDLLYLDDDSAEALYTYYAIPHWVEWSFYDSPRVTHKRDGFVPRCKMSQLQTIGIHGESRASFTIPYLDENTSCQSYDAQLFANEEKRPLRLRPTHRSYAIRELSDEHLSPREDHRRSLDGRHPGGEFGSSLPLSRSAPRHGILDHFDSSGQPSKDKDSDCSVKPITIKFKHQDHRSLHASPKNSCADSVISPASDSHRFFGKASPKAHAHRTIDKQILINPYQLPKKSAKLPSGRWRHIYIRPGDPAAVKWLSLCAPACLPLTTDFFPTWDELTEFYQEYTYTVSPNDEGSEYSGEKAGSSQSAISLLKELISQRLAQGFQLVVLNPAEQTRPHKVVSGFQPGVEGPLTLFAADIKDGFCATEPYYLSMGNHIHRLMYDSAGQNVEVKRYVRRIQHITSNLQYACHVWPKTAEGYSSKLIQFSYPNANAYNWNYLDHLISGYQEEMTEGLRFWRARFVLLPGDALPSVGPGLDEEETRLALFSKFLEQFQKVATVPDLVRSKRPQQDISINAMNISFSTLTPSAFMRSEARAARSAPTPTRRAFNFSSSVDKLTRDSKLADIARAMLAPASGLKISDRRWHLRSFENVMVGNELVDWFIRSFIDVNSRDEAVKLGASLLARGLLVHCRNALSFMDGHYFYQLASEYMPAAQPKPNISWFRHHRPSNAPEDEEEGAAWITMAKSMAIDLDLARKSNRQETAFLHYDTIYNPRHCYHFQLHWLGCTSRLIDDLLQTWSRAAEKCGLRLIEAPVAQSACVSDENPFRAPTLIHFSVAPPDVARATVDIQTPALITSLPEDIFPALLLQSFGFVLDVEADIRFQASHAQPHYSYNKPKFENSQYMHISGCALVQILSHGGGFLWDNNRLVASSSRLTGAACPPDQIRASLQEFCADPDLLGAFWDKCCNQLKTREGWEYILDDLTDDCLTSLSFQFGDPPSSTDSNSGAASTATPNLLEPASQLFPSTPLASAAALSPEVMHLQPPNND
ncbi:vacuolar membrane-associated protein iml1 [Entomophthora muscae]|uniref:Vacuolar membrane-associated protein iml1 n=1 Tax=Entomophthora muscae TaxID=34485 RepID=A0ACC2TRD3_9FUNG|nr:vacuolar membrane-associated protein iml1 [Entomophthora muscae]